MPELCEVTIISSELNDALSGCVIEKVFQSDWYQSGRADKKPEADLRQVENLTFSKVERVGKAILFKLENPGIGNKYIASRLGMSGAWSIKPIDYEWREKKKHWAVAMIVGHAQGKVLLVYSDTRKFGTLEVGDSINDLQSLKIYGPEILSSQFTQEWVEFTCSKKKIPIKALLLIQAYYPGIGNWLASEILAVAHINPLTQAKQLSKSQIGRLFRATHLVINRAINQGGASLFSWKNASGESGEAQNSMLVYGRKNEPCFECGAPIIKVMVNRRSTFYCKNCQREDWSEPKPVSDEYVNKVVNVMEISDGKTESYNCRP